MAVVFNVTRKAETLTYLGKKALKKYWHSGDNARNRLMESCCMVL